MDKFVIDAISRLNSEKWKLPTSLEIIKYKKSYRSLERRVDLSKDLSKSSWIVKLVLLVTCERKLNK